MALAIKKSTERVPTVLPLEQAQDLFEREARRLAGVSGEVFLARWDAGEYQDLDDTPEGRKITYLALLIPFGRRVS
jgi:hypothetical protein